MSLFRATTLLGEVFEFDGTDNVGDRTKPYLPDLER